MLISEVSEGQSFDATVYIVSAVSKVTKAGRNYVTGEVKDKSGVYRYNLWETNDLTISMPKAGEYAFISGRLEIYNNSKQINLRAVKFVDPGSINPMDFKKVSSQDIEALWEEFKHIVSTFSDPLVKYLAEYILNEKFIKEFKTAPAAENVHNAWVGGLLEHSLAVAKLADVATSHYNSLYFDDKINRDIVIFGSLFHDIGKIWEYDHKSPTIKSTANGELLGHIYMGANKISEIFTIYIAKNPSIDKEEARAKINRVLHVILAHHGKLEWGAPITPKTPEAIIVHYMDNLDTKVMNAWENLKESKEEFTGRNFIHENGRLFNILKD